MYGRDGFKYDGVGIDLLESSQANSMFAMKVSLDEWNTKVINRELKEFQEVSTERTGTREWIKMKMMKGENTLPLIIESKNNSKRPFHFGDMIEPGEKVIFLSQF